MPLTTQPTWKSIAPEGPSRDMVSRCCMKSNDSSVTTAMPRGISRLIETCDRFRDTKSWTFRRGQYRTGGLAPRIGEDRDLAPQHCRRALTMLLERRAKVSDCLVLRDEVERMHGQYPRAVAAAAPIATEVSGPARTKIAHGRVLSRCDSRSRRSHDDQSPGRRRRRVVRPDRDRQIAAVVVHTRCKYRILKSKHYRSTASNKVRRIAREGECRRGVRQSRWFLRR